jgi:hypothetical protein
MLIEPGQPMASQLKSTIAKVTHFLRIILKYKFDLDCQIIVIVGNNQSDHFNLFLEDGTASTANTPSAG